MDDNLRLLNDIRTYLRINAATTSREMATKVLDTKEKAFIYSKLDGKSPQSKLSEMSKIPRKTVSNWCITFVESGLASEPNDYYDNHYALFTLRELRIDVSKLKKERPESELNFETKEQESDQ